MSNKPDPLDALLHNFDGDSLDINKRRITIDLDINYGVSSIEIDKPTGIPILIDLFTKIAMTLNQQQTAYFEQNRIDVPAVQKAGGDNG